MTCRWHSPPQHNFPAFRRSSLWPALRPRALTSLELIAEELDKAHGNGMCANLAKFTAATHRKFKWNLLICCLQPSRNFLWVAETCIYCYLHIFTDNFLASVTMFTPLSPLFYSISRRNVITPGQQCVHKYWSILAAWLPEKSHNYREIIRYSQTSFASRDVHQLLVILPTDKSSGQRMRPAINSLGCFFHLRHFCPLFLALFGGL